MGITIYTLFAHLGSAEGLQLSLTHLVTSHIRIDAAAKQGNKSHEKILHVATCWLVPQTAKGKFWALDVIRGVTFLSWRLAARHLHSLDLDHLSLSLSWIL